MIKILQARPIADQMIHLEFSDGTAGDFDLTELIARDTEMTRPLRDPAFRPRCFLSLGALSLPNGLELSAASLQRKLAERGKLRRIEAVA